MTKIKNLFNKFFRKRKSSSTIKSNKVLFKLPKKRSIFKKRNLLNFSFNLKWVTKFFKKNYIPYYLIFWFCLILIIFFIVLGPIFRIEKINIYKDWNSNIDIAYKSVEDFRWVSTFNIEKSEVLAKMKDYQENIKDIKLDIDFPKTINIIIESYKEKFNVNINKKNYILLENWTLIPTITPSEELKNLEIIKNIEKTKILDYKSIFDMEFIQKIEEIEKAVKENIAGIEITWLKYYERQRELHIIVNNFTRLIFSLDNSISVDEQIKSLAVLDREKSKISNNDKVYIDLRIKWKLFYCSIIDDKNKQKEKQCNQNLLNIYDQL